MSTQAVVEGPKAEVLGPGPTLDELAAAIRSEHDLVTAGMRTTIDHAIKAGEALVRARELLMGSGKWTSWLGESFPGHRSQAYAYMRIASHQHLIPDGAGIAEADALLVGLPAIDGGPGRPRIEDTRKMDAHRMRREGKGYKEIAKEVGASPSTVYYWFTGGSRKSKEAKARKALKEKEGQRAVRRAVKKTGGALAEAYAMAERLDGVLGQARSEAEASDARRDIARAHEFQRAMRDMIVRSLGAER